MSLAPLATALVVPFEATEDDRRRGGRRQERLPRRNDQPAGRHRRARARRLCHHGARLPRVPAPRRARRSASRTSWPRWTSTTCARWPPPARVIRQWIVDTPLPPALEAGDPRAVRAARGRQPRGQLCGALVGHRRGPARRLVRRPAGDLPERHRHRRRAAPDQGGLRVALQRPRHQLPRAQGLRARRGRAVGRRAAHGALRPRLCRRDLHHRHRVRLQGRGLHHLQLRPGRDRGAGLGESRRVLRPQAAAGARAASR